MRIMDKKNKEKITLEELLSLHDRLDREYNNYRELFEKIYQAMVSNPAVFVYYMTPSRMAHIFNESRKTGFYRDDLADAVGGRRKLLNFIRSVARHIYDEIDCSESCTPNS
ncbi:hypothetical protein FACS1894152_3660 [Bacilli bacterium]|nr:hypothetical protein FACS1894152_3660 [Bacilli bacterium]